MQWHYARQGQQFGPVEEAELRRLAQEGGLTPDDLVWNPGLGNQWARAASIEGLFAAASSASLPAVGKGEQASGPASPPGATHNRDLMRMARQSLSSRWGLAVGVTVLYWVIMLGVSSVIPCVGAIASLVISGPMTLGWCLVFLGLARRADVGVGDLFGGFRNFGTALGAYLLMMIFILLWSLLLVIPGIIASYAYAMTFYVLADDPSVGPREAITRSKQMMRGRKWKLFCLFWRFFGWALLCILTFGIGFLWLVPYMQTALAHFYDDVRPGA